MLKISKKIVSVILVMLMVLSMFTVMSFNARAVVTDVENTSGYEGKSGDCTWSFDSSTGTLTVSGYGEMEGYSGNNINLQMPWYSYRNSIKEIVIENGVTCIGSLAFYSCANLRSIAIPDSVTELGAGAFWNCTSLSDITLPESITMIGYRVFANTAWYNSQPDGVIYAGKVAYTYKGKCPENIKIKNGTRSIANLAFYNCSNLKCVEIPNSVTTITSGAFDGCSSLATVTLPDGLTCIESGTFNGCTSIKNINIPDSVESIEYKAFYGCSIENVSIPQSVTNIEEYAFGYYDNAGKHSQKEGFIIYGIKESIAETYANDNGFDFVELNEFYFTTSVESNILALHDIATCAVSKTQGNLDGDLYDCLFLRWKSSDENVLEIIETSENYSRAKVKAVGYGSSILSFYVGSTKVYDAKITVGMSNESLKDNFTMTLLKYSQETCTQIINDYNCWDRFGVVFNDVSKDLGFSMVAKQTLSDIGLSDSEIDEALDNAIQSILKDYFDYGNPLGTEQLAIFKNDWKIFKTGMNLVEKEYKTTIEKAEKTMKNTLKKSSSFSDDEITKFFKNFKNVAIFVDDSVTIYELAGTAMMLAEFDKNTVKALLESFPKNSEAYKGLNRVYKDMNTDLETYCEKKYLSKKGVELLSTAMKKLVFLGHDDIVEVAEVFSTTVSTAYELSGSISMMDYNTAIEANCIAEEALKKFKNSDDSSKRAMLFQFCVSSVIIDLDNAISIAKTDSDDSKYHKRKAERYLPQVRNFTYEKFISDCYNEFNNPQLVKFDNPDLELYEISAKYDFDKYSINSKAISIKHIETVGTNYDSLDESALIIPSYHNEYRVTKIGKEGFSNIENISSIYLPDSITEIGDFSFYGCTNAESFYLGYQVNKIGDSAFMNCTALSEISLPYSLTEIGNSAFENCDMIQCMFLSSNLKSIGDRAFADCISLNKVYFYNAQIQIPENIFENCSEDLIIYGYSGSTAENFANSHGLNFESLGECISSLELTNIAGNNEVICGDELDVSGLSLKAVYCDGTEELLNSGFYAFCDTSYVGLTKAFVVYKNSFITYDVEVVSVPLMKLGFEEANKILFIGDTYDPNVIILPDNATDLRFDITSSDESVVRVEDNTLTAISEGKAEITLTTEDGAYSDICNIEVVDKKQINCVDDLSDINYFIPPESGNYVFAFESDNEINVRLYDGNGDLIQDDIKKENNKYSINVELGKNEVYVIEFFTKSENESITLLVNRVVTEHTTGDVDNNGTVNIDDVTLIQKYLASMVELDSKQLKAADVTGDGDITIDDVTAIQKYLAGMITAFANA